MHALYFVSQLSAEFSRKRSRRRKEIIMPRFLESDDTKARIVEREQLFQI